MSSIGTVGVHSLPPEILEFVLGNTVDYPLPEERPWTALRLTHVCGYFRHVALECPKLGSA